MGGNFFKGFLVLLFVGAAFFNSFDISNHMLFNSFLEDLGILKRTRFVLGVLKRTQFVLGVLKRTRLF